MANIQSQIKRNRQNAVRHDRNQAVRTRLKTRMRQFAAAADEGDREAATAAYRTAARELDKAATKGVIHRNKAANRKRRMARRLNQL